jgi:hypothetical protein
MWPLCDLWALKERRKAMCDDFDGEFNDYGDDGFEDNETDDYTDSETNDDPWSVLRWQNWMIIGPLSEDIAEEEKEREQIRRDMFGDDYLEPDEVP